MNRVVLIGRLTKDPELKFTPGTGTAVTTFVLAVDRRFSKDGKNEADFIPVVVWGKQAESTANYMSKGKLIGISGRIQTRSYEAKDGTRRYVTEVVADEVKFLEWGNKQSSGSQGFNNFESDPLSYNNEDNYNDDITPVDEGEVPF
ncbi:single-stranded DNA-binding protein [Clostridium tetani]|uniref:Single-stranded DNA-binding protein n=2 Tax=Clostridium tetani TaxID=1513 RepID=SSB_CLOTE|nr:single-stranded DNA-binding protein [Clostridium tetani]Q899R2.1 RecName: Full=Single-stranded DNA-binding protein; Short=SSB [Clostridium tetani E88]AAO34760.1 single-strand binding protein [Clostridium tetani E88]AVP55835.1 single-stranded DNA-binding protein [Clostridium tetani]KGI38868.1 single-stranded DNA-binding protein [Clostridium tetani ATCC 9441]KGI41315.1 single-stranded DNA-binding protein [Clostridium tetani]KGI42965.1 single-stranded DNA-binding protein [Clostridium tetani]